MYFLESFHRLRFLKLIFLSWQKPQPSDGGVYKCNIKNEFGELNANLNLNIEGGLLQPKYISTAMQSLDFIPIPVRCKLLIKNYETNGNEF